MILEFPAKQVTATLLGRSRKTGLLKYQEIVQKTTKEQFLKKRLGKYPPILPLGQGVIIWHGYSILACIKFNNVISKELQVIIYVSLHN